MKYGTTDFYATTANIIPVVILAYILSFRVFETRKQFISLMKKGFYLPDPAGAITGIMLIAPFVTVVMAIAGEAACLDTLYIGHATSTNAMWTVRALYIIGTAFTAHILLFLVVRFSHQINPFYEDVETPSEGNTDDGPGASGPHGPGYL